MEPRLQGSAQKLASTAHLADQSGTDAAVEISSLQERLQLALEQVQKYKNQYLGALDQKQHATTAKSELENQLELARLEIEARDQKIAKYADANTRLRTTVSKLESENKELTLKIKNLTATQEQHRSDHLRIPEAWETGNNPITSASQPSTHAAQPQSGAISHWFPGEAGSSNMRGLESQEDHNQGLIASPLRRRLEHIIPEAGLRKFTRVGAELDTGSEPHRAIPEGTQHHLNEPPQWKSSPLKTPVLGTHFSFGSLSETMAQKMFTRTESMLAAASSQLAVLCSPAVSGLVRPKGKLGSSNQLTPKPQPAQPEDNLGRKFQFAIEEVQEDTSALNDQRSLEVLNKNRPIIEELLVLGLDYEEAQKNVKELANFGERIKTNPQTVFRWQPPGFESCTFDSQISDQIKNFAFPSGYYITLVETEDPDVQPQGGTPKFVPLNKTGTFPSSRRNSKLEQSVDHLHHTQQQSVSKLLAEHIIRDNFTSTNTNTKFFLCFNSEETLQPESLFRQQLSPVLQAANPNLYLHYFCYLTHSLVAIDKDCYALVPRLYVVRTIYPLREFMFDALHRLLDAARLVAIEELQRQGALAPNFHDGAVVSGCLAAASKHELEILRTQMNILQEQIPDQLSANFSMDLQLNSSPLKLSIPRLEAVATDFVLHAARELLPNICQADFVFTLCALMQEKTVIFVSEDRSTLGLAIQLFGGVLHPLQWTFPVIYCLPEGCIDVLSSPVPLIAGLLKPADAVITHIVPDVSNKEALFVFLDHRLLLFSKELSKSLKMPRLHKKFKEVHESHKGVFSSKSSVSVSVSWSGREFSRKNFGSPLSVISKSKQQKSTFGSLQIEQTTSRNSPNKQPGNSQSPAQCLEIDSTSEFVLALRNLFSEMVAGCVEKRASLDSQDSEWFKMLMSTQMYSFYTQAS